MSTSCPVTGDTLSGLSSLLAPTAASSTPFSLASESTTSSTSLIASRIRFGTSEDILLLREVTVHEQPFARASPTWEEVAANLSDNCDRLRGITARAAKERTVTPIKSYITDDNKLKKMSGTDEQYTEKQSLLEDLRQRYEEREDLKVKTAAAKKKEAKDRATALAMRRAALGPLGEKRKSSTAATAEGDEADTDHIPVERKEKKRMNIRQLFEERIELKVRELDVRQQELEAQRQRVAMEQQRAKEDAEERKMRISLLMSQLSKK